MTKSSKARFEGELFEGHKEVTAVIVPFDPHEVWGLKPVKIDARRDGWLIRGTMNTRDFHGWIGYRWGRFSVIVDPQMREAASVEVGDRIVFNIEPTTSEAAMKIAREQAKLTTAPSRRKKAQPLRPPARRLRGVHDAHARLGLSRSRPRVLLVGPRGCEVRPSSAAAERNRWCDARKTRSRAGSCSCGVR